MCEGCFQWLKVTKMKANHNEHYCILPHDLAVSNGSKLLKWKQITTQPWRYPYQKSCFPWLQGTKMKANHNNRFIFIWETTAVSNGSKLLKWKQITTIAPTHPAFVCCFQWLKVTKMKANHNSFWVSCISNPAVSNGSKLLKWKQITTQRIGSCFKRMLFPMAQSY